MTQCVEMELVAGVGGMFGQLAVGLAASGGGGGCGDLVSQGISGGTTPFGGLNMAAKLAAAARHKSDITSLPDKVRELGSITLPPIFCIYRSLCMILLSAGFSFSAPA